MLPRRFAVTLGICAAIVVCALLPRGAFAKGILPPDKPGPFNVGVTTIEDAVMTGGRVTRIQVFYPTLEPANGAFRYTILSPPAGAYQLHSSLGVAGDAEPLPFRFPLVVHDHGGPVAGPDFQRVSQFPLHELMASHGFVTVVALHSASAINRVRDLSLVIDVLLARSADPDDLLSGSIDPHRIGISGISAGGAAAIGAAGGWATEEIVADARIKAMLVYEPSVLSLDDARTITIPYLVMGGLQSSSGLALPELFEATALASPRIYVLTPNATHFSYLTSMASEIEQTREAALVVNPAIPEPLTTRVETSAPAARAFDLWNQGQILFGPVGPGAGGGRNFCDRVGVNSVRSLDADGDGFTDSPPLMLDDPLLPLGRAIPEEVMVPLIKLYTVAFWKTFLDGDARYMNYLTPGYAKRQDLEAFVTIE